MSWFCCCTEETPAGDTPWVGDDPSKLFLHSGQFTSTLKTSQDVDSVDTATEGISWDGTNTPWSGATNDKLYLQSGQFTSTIKTSQDISTWEIGVRAVSWDGTNTPFTGASVKLLLLSGQFTSSLKTSQDVSSINGFPTGISYNPNAGVSTPWSGTNLAKIYLQSGQFTSTVSVSKSTSAAYGVGAEGISHDGNYPFPNAGQKKMFLESAGFNGLKTSQTITGITSFIQDISSTLTSVG